MSLQLNGVWKGAVWAATVWADGVWREGTPPIIDIRHVTYSLVDNTVHYTMTDATTAYKTE